MAPFRWMRSCVEKHERPLYACSFNPYTLPSHPMYLAVGGINQVTVYEINDNCEMLPRITLNDPTLSTMEEGYGTDSRLAAKINNRVYALNWLFDDRDGMLMIVFGGENSVIRIADVSSGKEIRMHADHGNSVNDLRVHPSLFTIYASASKDMTVRIWSSRCPMALAIVAGFRGHRDQILSCDWSKCGGYLASGSMDHTVRLWRVNNQIQSSIDKTCSPSYVYSEYSSRSADPFEYSTETCISVEESAITGDLHTNYVDCVRFFDDFLLTKSSENVLMISKFGGFEEGVAGNGGVHTKIETCVSQLIELRIPYGETWFLKFDIDPKKEWLLCGDRRGSIHVWHLSPLRLPSADPDFTIQSKGTNACIRQIAFEPHGRVVASITDDATITLMKRISLKPTHKKC